MWSLRILPYRRNSNFFLRNCFKIRSKYSDHEGFLLSGTTTYGKKRVNTMGRTLIMLYRMITKIASSFATLLVFLLVVD